VLTRLQREDRAGGAALLDDVGRLIGRLDLLGGLFVELEHAWNLSRGPCGNLDVSGGALS